MARLEHRTPLAWVERVSAGLDELLCDHAHCELRAEASARALIRRHPDRPALVAALSEVAREELAHHGEVVALLEARGVELPPARPNPYARALLACSSHRASELLLDRLLISSLIEARSLERFHLLSEHLADRELAAFYGSFVPAEAAHRALFVELARAIHPAERVEERLAELTAKEARIVEALPFAYRMHSGLAEPRA